ncbi:MAG: HAMP domain-containing sensor histidine kinase [Pseudomonadota bacterium]
MNAQTTWFERLYGTWAEPKRELIATVRTVRQRPWIIGLVVAANFLLFRLADFPTSRFVVLLAVSALPLAIAAWNAVQPQTAYSARQRIWRSLFATDVFGPAIVAVTGGLRSPFLPMLLANVIVMAVLWPGRSMGPLLCGACAVIGMLALLPSRITGPVIAPPYLQLMLALNSVAALYMTVQVTLAVGDCFITARQTLSSVRGRMLESAAQRVRSLEQVGSKVAHELKNPLAAIKSLLQLEEESLRGAPGDERLRPDAERSRRRFEVMTREVGRMEAVLRDYLSFSRPLEDLRIGPVDLAEICETVVVLLEGRATSAGVSLARAGERFEITGDGRRLEEALLNVAANAIEATPRGGSVTIRTEPRAGGVSIIVEDTGAGMTDAVLERVGTPFFTTRREGTGLGVVLARAALAQHGGTLRFASRSGQGTTVTMTVPTRCSGAGAVKETGSHEPRPDC